MRAITAYKAEDGTLHERHEDAAAADAGHEYRKRINAFIASSPLVYNNAGVMRDWLASPAGYAAAKLLVGQGPWT